MRDGRGAGVYRPVKLASRLMPRRFDLLILDLDGTLVDSEALLVGLVNETLVESGYPSADARGVGASIGLPLDEVFRRAAPGPETIDELCTRYRLHADAPEFVRQFRLYAGVTPTLAGLRFAGLRLVIATSKRRATTLDILRHCAIDDMIDAVIGGDCVTRGKPHPEMVHRAHAYFPTAAERTVVVGDARFDIDRDGPGSRHRDLCSDVRCARRAHTARRASRFPHRCIRVAQRRGIRLKQLHRRTAVRSDALTAPSPRCAPRSCYRGAL